MIRKSERVDIYKRALELLEKKKHIFVFVSKEKLAADQGRTNENGEASDVFPGRCREARDQNIRSSRSKA